MKTRINELIDELKEAEDAGMIYVECERDRFIAHEDVGSVKNCGERSCAIITVGIDCDPED